MKTIDGLFLMSISVDAEVLAKVLGNSELTALLTSLARTLGGN